MAKRVIAVIDLKAFYAYVECIDRGLDPFSTPLVVADKERGVNTIILSVTPYLKSFGIPSRLRMKELPKKFNYIYATPRMERYIEKSNEVVSILMRLFSKTDIHVYSIDEAFIDLTSYISFYKKTPLEIVKMVIEKINKETSLRATGGIGDNFFLAKVALDIYAKQEKDGIATLTKEDIPTKLWPITPLSKIWGIGPRLEKRLNSYSIFSVRELAFSDIDFIKKRLGIIGEQLVNHANGIDDSDVHEVYIPKEKSLTIGQTLWKDYSKDDAMLLIREMCDDLAVRLRSVNSLASYVGLSIGYSKSQGGFSKQMSLLSPTDNTATLFESLIDLYNTNVIDLPIRIIHICFGKLSDCTSHQLNLFESSEKQTQNIELQKTMDKIHKKYGKDSVTRASALLDKSLLKERHNQIGGHRK